MYKVPYTGADRQSYWIVGNYHHNRFSFRKQSLCCNNNTFSRDCNILGNEISPRLTFAVPGFHTHSHSSSKAPFSPLSLQVQVRGDSTPPTFRGGHVTRPGQLKCLISLATAIGWEMGPFPDQSQWDSVKELLLILLKRDRTSSQIVVSA